MSDNASELESLKAELAQLRDMLSALRPVAVQAQAGGADSLAALATTLAEITAQGNNKIIVDPAVMKSRRDGEERMWKLITAARERGEKPRYRLLNKVYFGNTIIEPFRTGRNREPVPQEISWSYPPNLDLKPLNAVAEEIFEAFRQSIGNTELPRAPLMSVTPEGLVIHGIAVPHRVVTGMNDDIEADDFMDKTPGLEVERNDDPRNKQRRVLGTVAEPLRDTEARFA